MSYLIDINEDLSNDIQEQIRKFRNRCSTFGMYAWFKVNNAIAKARDLEIYHERIERFIAPTMFDEDGMILAVSDRGDPQARQVTMVKQHLKKSNHYTRQRGRVTPLRLKKIMEDIVKKRVEEYLNPPDPNVKLKILCIVGESGCGKTLASLHLQNHKGANTICSFTTRPPRSTEVEGRDHHFIDIVPDKTDLIAFTHYGGCYYYATKWQVHGPCTVYVIDEKGLRNLKRDFGDVYDIYTMYIKRPKKLRRRCGVTHRRLVRDLCRVKMDMSEYDYIVNNNSTKKNFFQQIDAIYDEIINK